MPLTLDHIKQIEHQVIAICSHCTNLEDLNSAATPLWDWACQVLGKDLSKLRAQIESHETDEQFPTLFAEERDHLLKLPLVLLEELHKNNK